MKGTAVRHKESDSKSRGYVFLEAALMLPVLAGCVVGGAFYANKLSTGIRLTYAAQLIALSIKDEPLIAETDLEEVTSAALGTQPLPSGFNVNTYRSMNGDLKALTPAQAREHFIRYGRHEHRKGVFGASAVTLPLSIREGRAGIQTFSARPSEDQLANIPVKWIDEPSSRGWKQGNPHLSSCNPSQPYWVAVKTVKGSAGLKIFGWEFGGFAIKPDHTLEGKAVHGVSVVRVVPDKLPVGLRVEGDSIIASGGQFNLTIVKTGHSAECGNSGSFSNGSTSATIAHGGSVKLKFNVWGGCGSYSIPLSGSRVNTLSGGPANGVWDGSKWRLGVEDANDWDFNDGMYEVTASKVACD